MTTYSAFTTTGSGYRFVCSGEDKSQVRDEAERTICGDQWDQAKDIWVDTELKNLIVVPASTIRKQAELRHAVDAAILGV